MNNTHARKKYLLNEIKKKKIKEDKDENWYAIKINFDTEKFHRRCNSPSEFYKLLTNSKMGINGVTNREWYSRLGANGFYYFNETDGILEIRFLTDTKRKMSMIEFKARVLKICPYVEIDISYKDQCQFEKLFSKDIINTVFNFGIQLFGNLKTNKSDMLPY